MAHCFQPQSLLPGSQWMPQNQPCWSASTFRDLMQAIPRPNRQSSRISKPRSAGNSPSSSTARRTAQYQPPRPASAYNAALLAASMRRPTTRPTSWHPATFDSSAYCPPPAAAAPPQYYPTPTTPAPFGDASMLPPYALTASSFPAMPDPAPMDDESFLQQHMASTTTTAPVDPMAAAWDGGALTHPMSDGWSFDMMSMTHSVPCADLAPPSYPSAPSSACLTGAPSTPDGLFDQPSVSFSSSAPDADDDSTHGDELVGMGLYSNPDAPLSSLCGKGLKLEETFTPSDSDDKDAEADDDDDEEEAADDEAQAQPVPSPGSKPSKPELADASMVPKSFLDQDFVQPVVGAQQIFNLAQPCMNYGYGWI